MLCVARKVCTHGKSRGAQDHKTWLRNKLSRSSDEREVQESLAQMAPKDHEELSRKEAQFMGAVGQDYWRGSTEKPTTWPPKGSVGSGVVIADNPFQVNAPAARFGSYSEWFVWLHYVLEGSCFGMRRIQKDITSRLDKSLMRPPAGSRNASGTHFNI